MLLFFSTFHYFSSISSFYHLKISPSLLLSLPLTPTLSTPTSEDDVNGVQSLLCVLASILPDVPVLACTADATNAFKLAVLPLLRRLCLYMRAFSYPLRLCDTLPLSFAAAMNELHFPGLHTLASEATTAPLNSWIRSWLGPHTAGASSSSSSSSTAHVSLPPPSWFAVDAAALSSSSATDASLAPTRPFLFRSSSNSTALPAASTPPSSAHTASSATFATASSSSSSSSSTLISIPCDLLQHPMMRVSLIPLPRNYSQLFSRMAQHTCPTNKEPMARAALCLACGAVVCDGCYACNHLDQARPQGSCRRHMSE